MKCDIDDAIKTLENVKATLLPSVQKIVVLDRGWVVVGHISDKGDGEYIINEAAVIRVWGTTSGLPELQAGPTGKTKLDACSLPIHIPAHSIVFSLDIDEKAWEGAY